MTDRCPFCLEDVAPQVDWCERCGEPLSAAAEMKLAPQRLIDRELALVKARGHAQSSFSLSILSVLCFGCWFVFAPLAIGFGWYALYQHKKHDAHRPWQAVAGIVIGLLVLVSCGGIMLVNVAMNVMQGM